MKPINEILGHLNVIQSKPEKLKKAKKNVKVEIKHELVVQHNNLIEARYRLSLQEKRVILWLLTQIRPNDEDFKLHKLEIAEFSRMTGLAIDNQYSKLQEVTLNLMKRILKIYESHSNSILQIAWLSLARYHLTKGYVELRFDPTLKPYLLELKSQFTKLSIGDMMQLTSIYAMRFYELLKQYESIGQRKINVEDLREYCGIAKNEYKRYNDFKKDILERAKKEINEKTDIVIDYQEIKQSRKIVTIEWTIKKKDPHREEKLKLADQQKEFRCSESLIEAIIKYGFGRTTAKHILQKYEEGDIKNALRAVDLQIEKNHVRNPKAMLRIAIQEKWHPDYFLSRNKK